MRDRGDCLADDFDVWIDGFPRSAQTFASKSFHVANPDAKVRSHHHLPPFIINAIEAEKPGMLLVRKPEDAAVSWAVFWNLSVGSCLDYYIDFHRALLPHAKKAFLARFEEVTGDFGSLVERFNQRFGTHYSPSDRDAGNIFSLIAAETDWRDPELNHRRHCFPSSERDRMKAIVVKDLTGSGKNIKRLNKARALYLAIAGTSASRAKTRLNPGTRQLPAMPL